MPISRKSRRSRKVRLPRPQAGAMGSYSTKDSEAKRRAALRKDVQKVGYTSTMRDLNLRATLNKNKNPTAAKKMRADMEYLRRSRASRRSRKSR